MAVVQGGSTAWNHREPPRPALVQSQQGIRSPYACVQRGKTTLNLPEHVFLAPRIYTLEGKNMVLPVAWGTFSFPESKFSRFISYVFIMSGGGGGGGGGGWWT